MGFDALAFDCEARSFVRQARETEQIYGPVSITIDKAPIYDCVIGAMNAYSFPGEELVYVDRKWRNNRIESDHAALKRIIDLRRGFLLHRALTSQTQAVVIKQVRRSGAR